LEIRPGRLSCAAGSRIQAGAVTFKTIVPGWCSGRIIRIHVMIRTLSSSGSVLTEFTTQLFFRSDADQRADHFGFALQIARPAGHQQRGGQHRFSSMQLTLPTSPRVAVMLRP
jgi:protocatechuate 3,4-dioxygenase beta subunit